MTIKDKIYHYIQRNSILLTDKIAVAVSGGSDSLGLTLGLSELFEPSNIHAITIDHNLRKESGEEAQIVKQWLESRGLQHRTIKWETPDISGNIMQKAREARYQLLTNYCKQHEIKYLFIAHTLDDQIETFFIRLERGSGIDGLSGMREIKKLQDIYICRPLLDFTRIDIQDYLHKLGQKWINDPSNDNEKYLRIKIRKIFQDDQTFYSRIALAINNINRSSNFIAKYTNTIFNKIINQDLPGIISFEISKYREEDIEIRLRLLNKIIGTLINNPIKQRLSSIWTLDQKLLAQKFNGSTFANLGISHKDNIIYFYKLKSDTARKILPSTGIIEFSGYKIEAHNLQDGLEIGFPTSKELANYRKTKRKLRHYFPHSMMLNIPVVFNLENIIYIPHINEVGEYGENMTLRIQHNE